jgi:hypothetical protein
MRGEIKKSGQSAALGFEYDINIMGHWHQELMLPRAIVCNTLNPFRRQGYRSEPRLRRRDFRLMAAMD